MCSNDENTHTYFGIGKRHCQTMWRAIKTGWGIDCDVTVNRLEMNSNASVIREVHFLDLLKKSRKHHDTNSKSSCWGVDEGYSNQDQESESMLK